MRLKVEQLIVVGQASRRRAVTPRADVGDAFALLDVDGGGFTSAHQDSPRRTRGAVPAPE
jgi:hypothetical protein